MYIHIYLYCRREVARPGGHTSVSAGILVLVFIRVLIWLLEFLTRGRAVVRGGGGELGYTHKDTYKALVYSYGQVYSSMISTLTRRGGWLYS